MCISKESRKILGQWFNALGIGMAVRAVFSLSVFSLDALLLTIGYFVLAIIPMIVGTHLSGRYYQI